MENAGQTRKPGSECQEQTWFVGQIVIWTSAVQMYRKVRYTRVDPRFKCCQKSQITWFDVRKRLQTLKNDEKCWKQSLEVGQNT